MPANYVLLEKITVGAAGASTVTFNSIPQTGYTDLVVKASIRLSGTGSPGLGIYFNGSTANFSGKGLYGDGSAAFSYSPSTAFAATSNTSSQTANTFTNSEWYVPNYTSSNFKSFSVDSVMENNATTAYQDLDAVLWSQTAAITSITVAPSSSSFGQYSTFYLYGVAKLGTTPAIVPYATGGDTIMTDGTYWYHTFISSGTFTPQKSLTCDYLVVAGGGGGALAGAGGGAGGLRSTVTATGGGGSLESALSLGTSAYTVTIGGGGTGGTSGSAGTNGSNSVFSTITSTGGGYGGTGGGVYVPLVNSGGSGGGGERDASSNPSSGAAGTTNQGYAGGNGVVGAGGGGGGAGAVGTNGTTGNGGNGGNGVATSISGSSVTYAGGGGGRSTTSGTGGTGGGGAGSNALTTGNPGTANTGGGGGGVGSGTGGAGGSGIVIVRYLV